MATDVFFILCPSPLSFLSSAYYLEIATDTGKVSVAAAVRVALCPSLCLMWSPSPTAFPFLPSPFSPEGEERQSSPMSQETGQDPGMCRLSGCPHCL